MKLLLNETTIKLYIDYGAILGETFVA